MSLECLACQLTAGERESAGGRIFQTGHWVVEQCIGTLGVDPHAVQVFCDRTRSAFASGRSRGS